MPPPGDDVHAAAHDAAERISRRFQMNQAGYRQLRQLWVNMSSSEQSGDGTAGSTNSSGADTSDQWEESAVGTGSATDSAPRESADSAASDSLCWGDDPRSRSRRRDPDFALTQQRMLHDARERQEEDRRQRQELEIAVERASSRCRALADELARTRREKEAGEQASAARDRDVAHQAVVTQNRLDEALRNLATLDEGAQRAAAALRASLAEQLFIGDEQSKRLRAVPAEQLSAADWVRVRVHDAQRDERERVDALSVQCDELRRAAAAAAAAQSRAEADAGEARRQADMQLQRAQQTEDRYTALEEKLSRAVKQNTDDHVKLMQADRVLEEREQFRGELDKVRAEAEALGRKSAALEGELAATRAKVLDDGAKVWEAATQREAHEQVLGALRKREGELEAEKDRLHRRVGDLQQQLDAQAERHRAELGRERGESEARREKDVAKVEDAAARDISSARERAEAVRARELVQLTTERDAATQEAARARLRGDELEAALRAERLEWRRADDVLKEEGAELRTNLRLTKLELQRLEVLRDEQQKNSEELHLQAECEARKLAALKDEFYDVQRQHGEDRAEFTAVLAARNEKLRIYEELEADCDAAVERTAAVLEPGDEGRAAENLAQVPSAAGRRIQQSLHLARKAMRLEKDLATANGELRDRRAELTRARQELERVKGVLGNQAQPYQYFVDSLAKRDAELERAAGDLALAKGDARDSDAERRLLEQHCVQLQTRLAATQSELARLQQHHREFREHLLRLKLVPHGLGDDALAPAQPRKRKKKKDRPLLPPSAREERELLREEDPRQLHFGDDAAEAGDAAGPPPPPGGGGGIIVVHS